MAPLASLVNLDFLWLPRLFSIAKIVQDRSNHMDRKSWRIVCHHLFTVAHGRFLKFSSSFFFILLRLFLKRFSNPRFNKHIQSKYGCSACGTEWGSKRRILRSLGNLEFWKFQEVGYIILSGVKRRNLHYLININLKDHLQILWC